MKGLPSFNQALQVIVQEESRRESCNILKEKDMPTTSFNLKSVRDFSYKSELDKFQRTNPLLLASIIGTISKQKVTNVPNNKSKTTSCRWLSMKILVGKASAVPIVTWKLTCYLV